MYLFAVFVTPPFGLHFLAAMPIAMLITNQFFILVPTVITATIPLTFGN